MVSPSATIRQSPGIIDLFCGCGGFSLGAARAGFNLLAGIDFDEHAIASHARNFPNSRHLKRDLSKMSTNELLQEIGITKKDVAGIIGGPPCQGFSNMGSGQINDPRNRLFRRFFEIVRDIKPSFFVCENVPGILRPQYESIRNEALSLVDSDYNVVGPIKLKASDYGAPTTRTRAFFFGTRKNSAIKLTADDFLPPEDLCTVNVSRALSGLPKRIEESWQEESQGWRKSKTTAHDPFTERLVGHIPNKVGDPESIQRLNQESKVSGCLGTIHQPNVIARFESVAPGKSDSISRAPRLDPLGFCPTLRAGTGSDRGSFQAVRPIHPTKPRVITPREAARLQGFPDWFRFAPSKWHSFRQIGNSVSPILSEFILSQILTGTNQRSD